MANSFKNVHYITAGAGAGKTHTLVEIILFLIQNEAADPGKMMLTTFTDAAATEFRERSKQELLDKGRMEDVIALDRSVMGTLHSIASRYIGRYWYLLGMAPGVRPMDEATSSILMNRSLDRLVSGEQVALFKRYAETFGIRSGQEGYNYDFWKDTLRSLFNKLRGYGLDKDKTKVDSFRDHSLKLLKDTFHQGGNAALLSSKKASLDDYLALEPQISAYGTDAAKKQNATNCNQIRSLLALDPANISCKDLKSIEKMKWGGAPVMDGKKCPNKDILDDQAKGCHSAVKATATELSELLVPNECELIVKVTECLFSMIEPWIAAYEQIKKENGVIDYADMEEKFLELLGREEVQEDIKKSVDYLFVDEFQDSSPIQTRIFAALSQLVKRSWFVGDRKQAIYGFAGSDSGLVYELTKVFPTPIECKNHVTDTVPDKEGNSAAVLHYSYRSVRSLVEAANEIFSESFKEIVYGYVKDQIPKGEVELEATREDPPAGQEVLYHVTVSGDKIADRLDALATFICQMSQDPRFAAAGYTLSDIAVLTRWNAQAKAVAEALTRKNIRTGYVNPDYMNSPEVALILCLLKLSDGISTGKTRAEIRKLLHNEALSDLAQRVVDEQNDLTMFGPLEDYIKGLRTASLMDRINAIITHLDLLDECAAWGMKDSRRGHIQLLSQAAKQYSASAALLCTGADVRGFLSFLKDYKPEVKFDNAADGVKVLTYHKSKGLEWKIVILYGIDEYKEVESIDGITVQGDSSNPSGLLVAPLLPNKPWVSDCIENNTDAKALLEQRKAMQCGEEKRLQYVGFTRAKDALVTVAESTTPMVISTCCPTARSANHLPSGGKVDIWGAPGHLSTFIQMENDPTATSSITTTCETYSNAGLSLKKGAEPAPQKYVSPSLYEGPATLEKPTVTTVKDFGHRTDIRHSSLEDNTFGDLVHHVFAACRWGDKEANKAVAARTLQAYGITDEEAAEKLATCIGELYDYLGEATEIERELPFRYCENGQVFSGNMDLVWHTKAGCILVDYKTFPGKKDDLFDPKSPHWAGHYASQLGVYSRALKARDGKEPIARLLYYPIEGLILSV